MIKGLYTAYTGMVNEQKRLDVLTNNLANADTNGYKKEGTTSQTFADELAIKIKDTSSYGLNKKLGVISMGVHLGETYTNYDQGSIKVTDNETDVALAGNGFFSMHWHCNWLLHLYWSYSAWMPCYQLTCSYFFSLL
jgi:flagellar basal-body rod protein FlgF